MNGTMNSDDVLNDVRALYSDDLENNDSYAEQNDQDNRTLISTRNEMSRWGHYIEPVVFFLAIGSGLFDTAYQNVIEEQYCTSILHLPPSDCEVNSTVVSQASIQKFTSTFSMIRTSVEVLLPCLLSFFLGPWSDTYGRKPLLLSAGIGYCIEYSLWTWASSIPNLSPIYFILFSIPFALFGGFTILLLSAFCYACDITTLKNRSTRLGTVQAALLLGSVIGVESCSFIKEHYGSTAVFATATVLVYMSLIYTFFFLQESIIPSEIERNSVSKNPFRLSHLKNLINTCYTQQIPRNRLKIAFCTMIAALSVMQMSGELQVMYLFMQRRLHSSLEIYTNLSSFSIFINALSAFVVPYIFITYMKCDDLLVLSVVTFFRVLSSLVIVFGWKLWHLYFAKILGATIGIPGPFVRLFLSRIIPADELGKVFSLMSTAESSTPFFGSLLYTFVYNMTVVIYPEGVFVLSAILMLISLLILTILIVMHLSEPKTDYVTHQTLVVNS